MKTFTIVWYHLGTSQRFCSLSEGINRLEALRAYMRSQPDVGMAIVTVIDGDRIAAALAKYPETFEEFVNGQL